VSAAFPSDIPPDGAKYHLKDKHPKPECDAVVADIESGAVRKIGRRRRNLQAEDAERADEYEQVGEKSGERFFHGELSFMAWIFGQQRADYRTSADEWQRFCGLSD
jgi:hypothetical protein